MAIQGSIRVEAEVYVSDVLDDLSDKDILSVAEERGYSFNNDGSPSVDPKGEFRDMVFKKVCDLEGIPYTSSKETVITALIRLMN